MTKKEIDELKDFVKNLQGVNFHNMDKEEQREKALELIDPLNKSEGPLNELLDKFIGFNKMRSAGSVYRKGMYACIRDNGDGYDLYTSSNWEWWQIGCSLSFIIGQVSTLGNFFSCTSELDFNILARLGEAEKRMHNLKNKMMNELK